MGNGGNPLLFGSLLKHREEVGNEGNSLVCLVVCETRGRRWGTKGTQYCVW